MKNISLGVNIDHIATLRQQRNTPYPDIVKAAAIAEQSGADSITVHLREDRRHIQDNDVWALKKAITTKLNFEMALTKDMIDFACNLQPEDCCLVPEKRAELTTEGGLNVLSQMNKISNAIATLKKAGIRISPFIDADHEQIQAAFDCGARIIEIHTGHYANALDKIQRARELYKITQAARFAEELGIQVNAGHGLHYMNVQKIAAIDQVTEINIGHAIVAQAVFMGLGEAVTAMKKAITTSR